MPKTILDLCGGTGSWSRPYEEAGYNVVIVDPAFGGKDVRNYTPPRQVHGVLAAPPCTEFAVSGARWWKGKDPQLLIDAIDVVRACLRIIEQSSPEWWALENPVGRLPKVVPELGRYRWTFKPWQFGDPWEKLTCVWGEHSIPTKKPIEPWPPDGETGMDRWKRGPFMLAPKPSRNQIEQLVRWGLLPVDWEQRYGPTPSRAMLRSITPPGFARAFYEANP